MFGKYYGLRGTSLNIAIGVIAGMDFLLCMLAQKLNPDCAT